MSVHCTKLSVGAHKKAKIKSSCSLGTSKNERKVMLMPLISESQEKSFFKEKKNVFLLVEKVTTFVIHN